MPAEVSHVPLSRGLLHERDLPSSPFTSVRVGGELRVIDELERDEVNLAIWRRHLPERLEDSLLRWAKRRQNSLEQVISTSSYKLAPFLRGLDEPVRQWMMTDLVVLIAHFGRISGSKRIRVAFGPIKSDRCRKFHTDNLDYRLICTYAGPGTEWIPNEGVDRSAMDGAPGCPIEASARIAKDGSLIQHAGVGDVLLMKEDLHPHGAGLVHRSPPIELLGLARVALILSTVDGEWR